jgi:ketosteroid isomerase-like protein
LRRRPRPAPEAEYPVDLTPVAIRFITAINDHDVEALSRLVTDDHQFVDGLGTVVEGRDLIVQSWMEYFRWFPDYHITVESTLSRMDEVALFGSAYGTFAPDQELQKTNSWDIPAAFRAKISGDKVAEWHVYADNQPARRIMGRAFP